MKKFALFSLILVQAQLGFAQFVAKEYEPVNQLLIDSTITVSSLIGEAHGALVIGMLNRLSFKRSLAFVKSGRVASQQLLAVYTPINGFNNRVVELPSGTYLLAGAQANTHCPNFGCTEFVWANTSIYRINQDFTLDTLTYNLASRRRIYGLFQLGDTLFTRVDMRTNQSVSRDSTQLYKLRGNTWVSHCPTSWLNNGLSGGPIGQFVIGDTVYIPSLTTRMSSNSSCPIPGNGRINFQNSNRTDQFHWVGDTLVNLDSEFSTGEYTEGLTIYKPNFNTAKYEPEFLKLFNFTGFGKPSLQFRGQFASIEGRAPHPFILGQSIASYSPLVAFSHLGVDARVYNIARPSYDRNNFAGRIINGSINNDTTVLLVGSFTIVSDTLFMIGGNCTSNRVFFDQGGIAYPDTICNTFFNRNPIFYIPVSTIFDSLGITPIVTQTKPKLQTSNPNWRLYPNPAKELLQVAGLEPGERFTLLNSQGRQVGSLSYPAKNIPINHLPKGIYVGVWQGQLGMKTEKLVVE